MGIAYNRPANQTTVAVLKNHVFISGKMASSVIRVQFVTNNPGHVIVVSM